MGVQTMPAEQARPEPRTEQPSSSNPEQQQQQRRSRSPTHVPKTQHEDEQLYVLTLHTDDNLHRTMTDLRKKYFPPRLNHLEAHLTLFHALPESRLDSDILPAMEKLVSSTAPFELAATTPFKLRKGIAIGMPKDHGGTDARKVHTSLVRQWRPFLSQQDLSFAPHFTIMNKVDDEKEVDGKFAKARDEFSACFGTARGLSLYKYHPRGWEWIRNLEFQGQKR